MEVARLGKVTQPRVGAPVATHTGTRRATRMGIINTTGRMTAVSSR